MKKPTRAAGAFEVFAAFLKLGLTSFGGPIAHLGYFQRELVERRRWVDMAQFAQLIALCQFLPGPASSQLGVSLGMIRAGWPGAIAAFVAFTLPSAMLLVVFAALLPALDQPLGAAAIQGLKLLAVVVVAQGLVSMASTLAPDTPRRLIAVAVAAVMIVSASAFMQFLVVVFGAALGLLLCRGVTLSQGIAFGLPYGRKTGALLLAVFTVLLLYSLMSFDASARASVAAAFFRAGALVFGGGHVVLPLLEEAVVAPGWVTPHDFIAGYGAAQAVPGPMFSLAAFLGVRLEGGNGGLIGAGIGLASIFLPGLLLVWGALPFWRVITQYRAAASALAGVNAAVVGLLAAALYDPVWISAVRSGADLAIAMVGIILITLRFPVLVVLAWCVLASVARSYG
jgi:chromate transporter